MTITTRAAKGSPLTHAEVDENFTDLRDGVDLMVPSASGVGMRVDSLGTPAFGWRDLVGSVFVPDVTEPNAPTYTTYRGNLRQWLFGLQNEAQVLFHIPHDYLPGSVIYVHTHWSHAGTLVTGGSVTWGFELTASKGHNQQAFAAPVTIVQVQNASTTQYQHMICEAPASINGGSPNLLDTALIEVDSLVLGRVYLDSNNLTVSGGGVPDVFLHTVDIHYQSTNVPTKNKSPNFY